MALGKSIDTILAEAEQIVRVWEANPDFSMGELTLVDLKALISQLRASRTTLEETRTLQTQLVNTVNDKGRDLRKITSRARSGFRATYGPDSSQYEQAGSKRESEKKPRKSSKKGGADS